MEDDTRHSVREVVGLDKTVWVFPFLSRTSAQRAELIILTEVLKLGKDKWLISIVIVIYICHCTCSQGNILWKRSIDRRKDN